MIEKIKKALRHNQGLALAAVICLAMGVYLVGCESSVTSPVNPPKRVTRVQLEAEVERLMVDVELAVEDLNKQDLFKQKLFEIGLAAAQGGTINPVGAGVTLLGILGIGAVADNRKKDSIIKTMQKKEETV
jgi:hypothetical protein